MIKKSFVEKQIKKSKSNRKTTKFLRHLIFLIVDRVLKDHYKESYAMRCFQSSLAIGMILDRFEIQSKIYSGAVCLSQVFEQNKHSPNWCGFWGEDHHIWLVTEFTEFVDLTIHYLHLHPASKRTGQLQVPAIWWEEPMYWPNIIKYLPEVPVWPELPDDEMIDLAEFKKLISVELDTVLSTSSVQEIKFQPILHGIDSLNELHATGNPWLRESFIFNTLKPSYPTWIQEREAELMKNYENKI